MYYPIFAILALICKVILCEEYPFDECNALKRDTLSASTQIPGTTFRLIDAPTVESISNRSTEDAAAMNSTAIGTTDISKHYDIGPSRRDTLWGGPILQWSCNARHSIGGGIASFKSTVLSFYNRIGPNSPRFICLQSQGNNLCVSWAIYNPNQLPDGFFAHKIKFASECLAAGRRAQVKVSTSDYLEYACVSDRCAKKLTTMTRPHLTK